jgi:RHS repeat-associated protein
MNVENYEQDKIFHLLNTKFLTLSDNLCVTILNFLLIILITLISKGTKAQNTSYTPLFTNTTFSKTIDLTKPVGSIIGKPQVSESGGASYSIPITLPPGTNGVVPSLSISYSSEAASSLLGFGWDIDGLSSITRGVKNWYNDGKAEAVTNTDKDAFFMDGSRLILLSGVYGAIGSEYAIENENFSRAKITNNCANGPWVFDVTTKDGTILEYGNEDISKGASVNNVGNWVYWRLFRIMDKNGNYVEYTYDNSDNDSRIKEINYTGNVNTGLLPFNKIKFEYSKRQQENTTYEAGLAYNHKYLLEKILITGENNHAFKTYDFKYGTDNIHSFLKEIIESGTDGTTLNSTILKYGDQPAAIKETYNYINGTNLQWSQPTGDVYYGDYNGDGLTDLMTAEWTYGGNLNGIPQKMFNNIRVSLNTPANILNSAYNIPITNSVQMINKESYSNSCFAFTSTDFNGDGRDDIALTNTTISNNKFTSVDIHYSDGGSSFIKQTILAPTSTIPYVANYDVISPQFNYYYQGDFDGDGRSDYLTFLGNFDQNVSSIPERYKANISFPSTNSLNNEIYLVNSLGYSEFGGMDFALADVNYVLDFNGDGKSDIMSIKEGSCKIYEVLTNTTHPQYGPYKFNLLFSSGYPTKWHSIRLADFNGDRKTDLLTFNEDPNTGLNINFEIAYSTGLSFVTKPLVNIESASELGVPSGTQAQCLEVTFEDYNGDGKSDIAVVYALDNGTQAEKINIYYSTGINFVKKSLTISNSYNFCFNVQSGDLNSDGRSDIIWKANGASFKLLSFQEFGKERLLEKITDGINSTIQFEYKLINSGAPFYKQGVIPSIATNLNAGYPINSVSYPLYNVSKITTPNGIGGVNSTEYNYENARVHKAGKGYLGFEKVITYNILNDLKTVSESELNSNYFIQMPKAVFVYKISSGSLINSSVNNNLVLPTNNNRFKVQLSSIIETNNLQNIIKTTTNSYDNFLNILTSEQKINNLQTRIVDVSYINNGLPFPNLPSLQKTTNIRTGQPPVSKSIRFDYDLKGNLISREDFEGLPSTVKTSNTYNSYGNILSETISAINVAPRTISYSYDSKNRFRLTKSKACNSCGAGFSQTESYTYSSLWGLPLVETSSDCKSLLNEYDAFGRLIKTILSDGNTIDKSIEWDISAYSISKLTITQSGKPTVITWLDNLSRETKLMSESYNGSWVTQITNYNNKGLIANKTNMYIDGVEIPNVTNFIYDDFNRIKTEITSNNQYSYDYIYNTASSRLIMTKTDWNAKFQKTITDASGQIIKTEDNGGSVNFIYDSWGNQKAILQNGINVSSTNYNLYNKVSSKTEPNAGTIRFDYNAYGELITQTDAKGNVYNFEYDELGRMIKRTGNEGITSYEYYCKQEIIGNYPSNANHDDSNPVKFTLDSDTKNPIIKYCCNNNITKIIGYNGITQNFHYDNLGRIIQREDIIDGTSYLFDYGYDVFNNNISTKYPSGIQINNNFDSKGFLISVNQQGYSGNIYELNSLNGMGQITSYNLGNGLQSTQAFDDGYPVHFITSGIQDYELVWNKQANNLTSRRDNIYGLNEVFNYDNLNRLVSSEVIGQPQQNYQYDPLVNGNTSLSNIKIKDDAGYYRYAGTPHAQSSISNISSSTAPPPNISSNLQDIEYTPFQRISRITENSYEQLFTYEPGYTRVKSELFDNGVLQEKKYYFNDFEIKTDYNSGITSYIHYVNSGVGTCAVLVVDNNGTSINYIYKDHLGSFNLITDNSGNIIANQNFDAWGRNRNPVDWTYTAIPSNPEWLYRGYTGHEHMPQFGLINMNARLYDPTVGKMISLDNYVADPYNSQAYNRYNYANNNPLIYVDPDGNHPLVVALIVYGVFFTETGYKVQKVFSPVAVHVQVNIGSNNRGIGIEASVGLPQIMPFSYRIHGGVAYNWRNYYMGKGWETKWGSEVGIGFLGGGASYATTKYNSPGTEFDQTTGQVSFFALGGLVNLNYENDWFPEALKWVPTIHKADEGDRFRTAALRLNFGIFSAGFNVFTGDPWNEALNEKPADPALGGNRTGIYTEEKADLYRAGVLYFGIGPLRIGANTEGIRHAIQNRFAHDFLLNERVGWFRQMPDQFPNKFYWNFGSGYGGNMW